MLPLLFLAMVADDIFAAEKSVPDAVLAEQRGGFQLPGGLDVGLAVQTQTAVDGRVVLATVFTIIEGAARFTPYVPRPGETIAAPGRGEPPANASSATMPTIRFDARNGISVTPGQSTAQVGSITAGGATALPDGLVEAAPGAVSGGMLNIAANGALRRIEFHGGDISITHLAGSAFGSAIANTASDRAIDTTTSVSIDLRNATPENLGSAAFRISDITADALTRRAY